MAHVPKFGNWEADNIPYSLCFENARREKGGLIKNPNDVSENINVIEVKPSSIEKSNSRRHLHHRRSKGSFKSEFSSEKSHVDHSVMNKASQSDHSRHKGSFKSEFSSEKSHVDHSVTNKASQSDNSRHKSRSHSFNDHKETEIPEFGSWDVNDPKSGEAYTVMFNKVKEDRKIMTSRISGIRTPPHINGSNQYDGSSFNLSKYCCCMSTSERK